MKLRDSSTGRPIFTILQIQLACAKCIEDGKSESCVHMLHLAPRWQVCALYCLPCAVERY
eukprot:1366003-Rhodomonas_salina.1